MQNDRADLQLNIARSDYIKNGQLLIETEKKKPTKLKGTWSTG